MKKRILIIIIFSIILYLGACDLFHKHEYTLRFSPQVHFYICECGDQTQPEEHQFVDGAIILEPTEDNLGKKKVVCEICNYSKVVDIPKKDHVHDYNFTKHNPNCTDKGYTEYYCKCGETYIDDYVDALGHELVDFEDVDPTCTTHGYKSGKYCSRCFEEVEKREVIPALEHNLVEDKGFEATCTENGLTDGKHCSTCGEITEPQEVIYSTGHNILYFDDVPATCDEIGYTGGTYCSICNEILTEPTVVQALGHKKTTIKGVAATCYEDGLTNGESCNVCNKILIEQEVIPKLTHNFIGDNCEHCGLDVNGNLLKYEYISGRMRVTGVINFENNNIIVPKKVNGKFVEIGNNAFSEIDEYINITLPNSIKTCKLAFKDAKISNVYYSGTLLDWCEIFFESIDSTPVRQNTNVFMLNESNEFVEITNVTVPDEITKIQSFTFANFSNMIELVIPETVTKINSNAFAGCGNVEKITTPTVSKSTNWEDANIGNFFGTEQYEGGILVSQTYYTHHPYSDNHNSSSKEFYIPMNLKEIIITGVTDKYSKVVDGALSNIESLEKVTIKSNVSTIGYGAFYGCKNLKEVIIEDGVTKIEKLSFAECSSLVSIIIPDTVTKIGEYSFYRCNSLETLTIPFVGTTIEHSDTASNSSDGKLGYLFEYINANDYDYSVPSSLKSVIITKETFIDDRAFDSCISIKNITLPETIIGIGPYAFIDAYNIDNVYYEGTIESWCKIGMSSSASSPMYSGIHFFMRNENDDWEEVVEITIPDTVTSIGYYTFEYFDNILSITIPASVKRISDGAFYCCNKLVQVNDYTNLDLANYASKYGLDKTIVHQKGSNQSYLTYTDDGYVFLNHPVYTYGLYHLVSYLGDDTELVLPSDINGQGYKINDYAFSDYYFVTSIQIPETVTSIGEYAFYECYSLESIVIPNSVTSIGDYTFSHCTSIRSISFSNKMTTIPTCALDSTDSLIYIYLPKSINKIGYYAIGYSNLQCVFYEGTEAEFNKIKVDTSNFMFLSADVIYNTTKEFKYVEDGKYDYILYQDKYIYRLKLNLSSVYKFESEVDFKGYEIVTLATGAFQDISSLRTVILGEGIEEISSYAFENCWNLEKVVLPESVKTIKNHAFADCEKLTDINLSDSITFIDNYAFKNCIQLETVYVSKNIEFISECCFQGCTGLTSIHIPSNIKYIGSSAFSGCKKLKDITFEAGLKSLYVKAFSNCTSIEYMYLPKTLEVIGTQAFIGCSNLKELVFPNITRTFARYEFDGCVSITKIYYLGAYENSGNVSVDRDNGSIASAKWYYYSEKTYVNNGWFYDSNGIPTRW